MLYLLSGWAASTGNGRSFNTLKDLPESPVFGVSRLGSGSHIMAYYLALKQGWDLSSIKFEVLGDLKGLASGVTGGAADLFLWEKFTTKPLYDSGLLKYVGEIVAPWPSFTIVAHRNYLKKPGALENLRSFLILSGAQIEAFSSQPQASRQEVVRRFQYKAEDVALWWDSVSYPSRLQRLSSEKLGLCASILAPSCNATVPTDLKPWSAAEIAEWM